MRTGRGGFTAVELVIVLIIGAMLISAATRSFSDLQSQRDLDNARDALIYLSHRAKAEAMRRGEPVRLQIAPSRDTARVITVGDSVVKVVSFIEEHGADMIGSAIQLCYAARGFALSSCTSTGLPKALGFTRATGTSDTLAVLVLPLGQIGKQ